MVKLIRYVKEILNDNVSPYHKIVIFIVINVNSKEGFLRILYNAPTFLEAYLACLNRTTMCTTLKKKTPFKEQKK